MATIREQAIEYLKQQGYENLDEGEIQGAIREVQGSVVVPELQKYLNEVQVIQTQIANMTAQAVALKKYGLKDTSELTQDATGNWVPKPVNPPKGTPMGTTSGGVQLVADGNGGVVAAGGTGDTSTTPSGVTGVDEAKAFEEAAAALEPDRTTELSELEAGVALEKQRLTEDWTTFINDINTGKLRAGTDQATETQRLLEQKSEWIAQQQMNIRNNMQTLNRNWMQKGGLFSGVRLEAGQNYLTEEQMAKQRYESQLAATQKQVQTGYERTLEDYQRKQALGQTALSRGIEDVGLTRIKNIRSLNQYYRRELSNYAGNTNYASNRMFTLGY